MKLTVSTPSGLHIEYEPSNSLRGPDGVKLTVSTPSGLHIEFEGSGMDLPRLDDFLLQIARIELQRVKLPAVQQPVASLTTDADETFVPFPDPSPPTALALAAEPDGGDHRPDTPATGTAGESSRPPARTSPRAGGTGRPAHSRDAVIAALRDLGPSKVKAISEHTGLTPKAIEQVLYRQRVNGTVVHNGVRGPGSRWSLVEDTDEAVEPVAPPIIRRQQSPHEGRVIGASARAAMDAQRDARHDGHHDQVIALVAEHGPVAPAWVADQLVKNRRDTAALMRDMAAAGELVEQDAGGYDIPDRDDQDLAA